MYKEWYDIDWVHCESEVKKMQVEIAVAFNNDDKDLVSSKQEQLVKSFEACACAVKKVMTNQGSKTPGVDGKLHSTPNQKIKLVNKLLEGFENYKSKPVKRVWILKPNGGRRPIGIPTI